MDPIEDSLDLHPVPFSLSDGEFALPSSQSGGQDALPFNIQKTIPLPANLLCSYPLIFLKSQNSL